MHGGFYLPEDPDYTILDSARDSVRFAHLCLKPTEHARWRATSSFVDVLGRPMLWHDFGKLEGPGWAANAVGGGYQLVQFGQFDHCHILEHVGRGLIDHVLEDGFLSPDGFIAGYRDTTTGRLCLNYKAGDDWFCPGSMARVALQMLWAADTLGEGDRRTARLLAYAPLTAEWILRHVPEIEGWWPRRCRPEGTPYDRTPEGGPEPLHLSSGDGLTTVWLLVELALRGIADHRERARGYLDHIVARGGIYGSINHDTYDADESVARATACRLFLRAARLYDEPAMREFAIGSALKGLDRFQMKEDRNGVATTGLLYMEDSWDTAYLWENAEAALAYLDAFEAGGDRSHLCCAVTILRAIARHHHGESGFLTEGVDWNNHVGREHHIDSAEFGDIRYTEPLLNNLHHVEPAIRFLSAHGL
ncbi:MAG TPA: hypothetical protein VLH79_05720 [Chthonomonadales bacterium]|nr:hypothetical protein [Chthonomonadales bacterium]